jgi:hypothetical protein
MEYNIAYDSFDALVIVTIEGLLELGSLSKMLHGLADELLRTNATRILLDLRDAEAKMSLIELITLSGIIQSVANQREVDIRSMRRAIVSQQNGRMMELYEITAQYIGGPFARFQDLEDAKTWLKE